MEASIIRNARFEAADRAMWADAAKKALRGGDPDTTLVARSDDGLAIGPVYERAQAGRHLARAQALQPWKIVQRVDDPDPERAREQVIADLEGGATGISLIFEGAPNAMGYGLPMDEPAIRSLIDVIAVESTHLRVDVHPASRVTLDWMVPILARKRVDPSKLSLSFGIDPAAIFAGTGRLRMSIEALKASMPQSLVHFFAMQVPGVLLEADGRVYHNGGATEAQELGATISAAVSHLRMFETARQPLIYAAPHIGFAVAADHDQFMTTAKLRALRVLWARVQETCGIEPAPAQIHAETSMRMMTRLDPETNILRSTIAAFGAVVGGADAISVIPHTATHGLPASDARRLARNTQLILARESHVGFTVDPASGSGGIEALTGELCEAAWNEFRRIEAEGGILESLRDGKLQARIAEARQARRLAFQEGKRALVGTTRYRAERERPVEVLNAERRPIPTDGIQHCEMLPISRIDETLGSQG